MPDTVRRVALLTHHVSEVVDDALREALDVLEDRGVEVLLPPGEVEKHPSELGDRRRCCETTREEMGEADLCLVLGGDGTMLRALRYTRGLDVPVVGVNLGRVGFFAAVPRACIARDLGRVLQGEFVEHRLLGLDTAIDGLEVRAVNDLLVGHGRETGVARLSYELNDVPLFDVRCDGLLVSTPAGSTAYNLAVGGPVLGVGMRGFIVSYVAPHALATRNVVAAADDVLVIRNRSRHQSAQIVADGDHVGSLPPRESLEVRTVPDIATLGLLPESSFYRQFRDRFVGEDSR